MQAAFSIPKILEYGRIALDFILPPRCTVTGSFVDRQGMLSPEAFAGLHFIVPPYCDSCGVPFDFEVEQKTKCSNCLSEPPVYKTARAAVTYNDTSRTALLGFKHSDRTYMVKSFVPWLMRAGSEMLEGADLLIPVPLHYRRLVMRRYNQADLLAKALGKASGVECEAELLCRLRATPSQGHLKAGERAKNVRRAFGVPEKYRDKIKDKRIVLIDDVYTTGATVNECTKALMSAGAKEVSVLTIARVVKGEM